MSDLTFNKYAGAVLATGFTIAILIQVSSGVFSEEKVAHPGFKVAVTEETGGGAAAADVPPDWGTVLPKADVSAGQATFAKCQSCHSLTANGTGPNLTGVVGRKPGTEAGFAYSDAMKAFGDKTPVWDYDHLYEFIKGPQAYLNGTKMTFVGLKAPEDRINVIAFLRSQGGTLPIPAPKPAAAAPAAGAPEAGADAKAAAPGAAKTDAGAAKPEATKPEAGKAEAPKAEAPKTPPTK